MALRTVFTVDVDNSKFKSFIAEYKKYQDMLAKTPKAWADAAAQAEKQSVSFSQMVAALLAQSELASKFAKEQKSATVSVQHQSAAWHKIAHDSKSFASNILGATKSFLRWSGAISAITGLVGVGGLWGLDKLASVAGGGLRSAQGLGLSFGEQKAFGVNFGRVVDPDQFLGGVNAARTDLRLRPALYGAGLTEGDIHGRDTAQVAVAAITKIKGLVDQTPTSQLGQLAQARHLGDLGLSVSDLERIKSMSAAQLRQYEQRYLVDRRTLSVTTNQLQAWQNLQVQLSRAGSTIESSLIRGLGRFAPEISSLSKSFATLVDNFSRSPEVKKWLDVAADGLHRFADFVGTPAFAQEVQRAVTGVGEFASAAIAAAKRIEHFFGFGEPDNHGVLADPKQDKPGWDKLHQWEGGVLKWLESPWAVKHSAYRTMGGLPPGLLKAVAMTESGGNDSAVNPRTGAMGAFQFMPATWAQYGGGGSPFDPAAAAQAARRYLGHLLGEFGSVEKALAGYNWGPGNLERELKQFGAAWRQHLPAETQHYLARILPQIGAAPRQPAVTVQDRTGGSVVISGAQLAT